MDLDLIYLLFVAPGLLLALWAAYRVRSTFRRFADEPTHAGLTGAEVALELLQQAGLRGVAVERHVGLLPDHYDPTDRVVRLSPHVYHGQSIAAVGVAAHACGHALRHVEGRVVMRLRQALVGPATLGASLSLVLIAAGMLLELAGLIWGGTIAFSAGVLFQLATLPVELDASTRARRKLLILGIVGRGEAPGVVQVLNAAALTYVAALVTSLLTLAHYIVHLLGLGRAEE